MKWLKEKTAEEIEAVIEIEITETEETIDIEETIEGTTEIEEMIEGMIETIETEEIEMIEIEETIEEMIDAEMKQENASTAEKLVTGPEIVLMKEEETVASIAEAVVILPVIARNQEVLNSTRLNALVLVPALALEKEKDLEDPPVADLQAEDPADLLQEKRDPRDPHLQLNHNHQRRLNLEDQLALTEPTEVLDVDLVLLTNAPALVPLKIDNRSVCVRR